MTALPGVRKRRTSIIAAMVVAALVAIAALGYMGLNALRHYEGAKLVDQPDRTPFPATNVGMLAITDETTRLAGLALAVSLSGDQVGGYLLPLPTSVDSTFGVGDERVALTAVFAQEGIDGLALAVEGALSITLDSYQAVTPAEAEALLAPVGVVQAQLPRDVRDTVADVPTVLFPAGATELTPAQIVQVLTAEVIGEPESVRRDNINAVWAAIATAVGAGKTTWVAGTPVLSLSDLFTRVFAGTVVSQSFPTIPIPQALNPKGLDVENIDQAEAVMWLASVAPASMSAPGVGLTYRIEAPSNAYLQEVKAAIAVLLAAGANVKSVWFAGPVLPFSLALITSESERALVTTDVAPFGGVEITVNSQGLEGIDVVLQLGSDYLDAVTTDSPTTLPTPADSSTTIISTTTTTTTA